ncbi:hypothetical protein Q5H92_10610 [Hymenobacter sp. M29]|uniref:Uncharacterized protein n=1 Tax=Hymenobacter mellowenesis TaxID=3063995 RepID=A0ABT9AAE8_9BACT|nr:hypothetical protein [Hymenobacter sp. M29]MDO7846809.1 hypothetical protein [Hymenobacter sp. M29]
MTLTRHGCNVLASALLFLGYGYSTFLNYFTREGFFAPHLPPRTLLVLLASVPVVLGLYYLIGRGKRWAQALFVALYLLSLGVTVWQDAHRFPVPAFRGELHLVNEWGQYLLHGAAVGLLLLSFFKQAPAQETAR